MDRGAPACGYEQPAGDACDFAFVDPLDNPVSGFEPKSGIDNYLIARPFHSSLPLHSHRAPKTLWRRPPTQPFPTRPLPDLHPKFSPAYYRAKRGFSEELDKGLHPTHQVLPQVVMQTF